MTIFIACVGSRDPFSEKEYDPDCRVNSWEERGEKFIDRETGKEYSKGPIISFFDGMLIEHQEFFRNEIWVYLFGTRGLSFLFESDYEYFGEDLKASNFVSIIQKLPHDKLSITENNYTLVKQDDNEWLIKDASGDVSYLIRRKENKLRFFEVLNPGEEMTYKKGKSLMELLGHFTLKSHIDSKIECWPLYVENPSDSDELFSQIGHYLECIKREAAEKDDVRYVVDPQPGTPQMAYAFIAHAVAGTFKPEPRFLEYVLPRNRKGGLGAITEDNISSISQIAVLKRAQLFFQKFQFESAKEAFLDFGSRSSDNLTKGKAEVFVRLSEVYSKWDLRQYSIASDLIESLIADPNAQSVLDLEVLKKQNKFLGGLIGRSINRLVVDLYYSAKRRFKQRSYSDAILNCALIDEIIVFDKAKGYIKSFKKNTQVSKNPALVEWFKLSNEAIKGQGRSYVRKFINTLQNILPDEQISYLDSKLQKNANEVYKLRNSIVHEAYPANSDEAKFSLETAGDIIKTVYGNEVLENFIFDDIVILQIADSIITSFTK